MTGHVFAALAKRLEIGQLLEQSAKNAQLKLEKKQLQNIGGQVASGKKSPGGSLKSKDSPVFKE